MRVLVIGGGIGGLSAALALSGDGHRVTVVEQAPGFAAVGAGIVLAPNAVQVLAGLGVDLAGSGQPLRRTEIRAAGGDLLNAIDLAVVARRYGPSYGIARSAMQALLVRGLPATVDVVLGCRVEALQDDGETVDVDWGAGPRRFDVVVAADGLHSAVRAQLCGPHPLRYSGTTCWRGTLPLGVGEVAVEAWGRGSRVGVVPIGAGEVYYYLVRSAPAQAPAPGWPDSFREAFAGYRGTAGSLLTALDAAPALHHDLFELDRPFWGRSRVLLLGDAAHAMTPNQGQGAAMAIEDASAVALALRSGADGALQRYRAARASRVRAVQLTSRRIGAVAHWRGAGRSALRDAALRLTPGRVAVRSVERLVAPGVDLARRMAPPTT